MLLSLLPWLALPHHGPHHPLLFFHPLLLELLPPLLNLSPFGGQGLAMMGDGNVSGPPDPSIPGAMCLTSSGPFSGSVFSRGWGVFSPRPTLPQPPVPRKRLVVTSAFLPEPRDAKTVFLGTLSTSPCTPPTNKSTVLQLHRKPGLNLCCVTLGKFLSVHGPPLPHRHNGTDGNRAYLLGGCGLHSFLTW